MEEIENFHGLLILDVVTTLLKKYSDRKKLNKIILILKKTSYCKLNNKMLFKKMHCKNI